MYRQSTTRTLLIGLFNSEAEHERIYNENKFNSLLTFIHKYTDLKSLPQKKTRNAVMRWWKEWWIFRIRIAAWINLISMVIPYRNVALLRWSQIEYFVEIQLHILLSQHWNYHVLSQNLFEYAQNFIIYKFYTIWIRFF